MARALTKNFLGQPLEATFADYQIVCRRGFGSTKLASQETLWRCS
jgi:hypothetical protein